MKSKNLKALNNYSHGFKTPLAKIKALVELIRHSKRDESIDDKLDRIGSSVDSVNLKIETFFTYLNLDDYPNIRKTFDLNKILQELAGVHKIDIANIGTYKICTDPNLTRKMLNLLLGFISLNGGKKLFLEFVNKNPESNLSMSFEKPENWNDHFVDEISWELIENIASGAGIGLKLISSDTRLVIKITEEKGVSPE